MDLAIKHNSLCISAFSSTAKSFITTQVFVLMVKLAVADFSTKMFTTIELLLLETEGHPSPTV